MGKYIVEKSERPKALFFSIKYLFLKPAIYLLLFSFLHFIYDLIPSPVTLFLGANDESVFSHLKMAFWSCILIIIVEYALFRKHIVNRPSFCASRSLSAILAPIIEIVIWYIVPAIARNPIPLEFELPWAFIVVYLIGFCIVIIEQDTITINFNIRTLVIISTLVVIELFFFTAFTFEKPWIDIFALPE